MKVFLNVEAEGFTLLIVLQPCNQWAHSDLVRSVLVNPAGLLRNELEKGADECSLVFIASRNDDTGD